MKNLSKSLLLGLCLVASGVPTLASAGVGIDINIAPPAPRVEVLPGPRMGYVWAPGFWDYRGRAHVWVPGRFLRERRGSRWIPDHWAPMGPRWHHERGHWDR